MTAPDYDVIVRDIITRQLSWSASTAPVLWVDQTDEYMLIVQDDDLSRAVLWCNQAAVARVDLSTLTVEAGASC